MANWANCCLLLLPCRITRLRRATYPNPKFAKHPYVPLTPLGGTSRCFARPNCRAEHVNVPLRVLQRGWRCFAIIGLGTGISPISRTGKAILSRMRRLAVLHLPIWPLAHGKGPSSGFWWGSMCGCLEEWRRGRRRSRVKPAMRRRAAAAPSGALRRGWRCFAIFGLGLGLYSRQLRDFAN